MDHTGDHHHTDGEPGHDAGPDADAVSGDDVPVESGDRSHALLAELVQAERARIHAEARVSQLIIDIDQARATEASTHYSDPRVQALEAASAADDMSLDLGLTAGAVAHRVDEYTFIVTHMPLLWARHQDGQIDAWRLHIIAETTRETLTDPANYTILDEKLAAWLSGRATYTPGQLRAWLRRTTARLEPENQRERTRRSWHQRSAHITHDDDGTTQLFSVLSSEDGIAIDDLINQLARTRAHNTDGLTTQQARADIIADLLLGRTSPDGHDTGSTRVQARIGVTVPISTLAGLGEQPAISIDGQTALSAAAVRELASLPGTLFRRLLTDQTGNNLLEVTGTRYQASPALREAIAWRDGTCTFPTCSTPATRCDLDHHTPWPDGPTNAQNLHYLCRRHHRLKTHGLLPTRDPT